MKSPARMALARLIAFLVATTVCQSAFSDVIGFPVPVVPESGSTNSSLILYPDNPPGAAVQTQYGTGNGQVLDDGVGHATALYTGGDGSVVAKISAGAAVEETVQASVTWYFMVVGPPPVSGTTPLYVPLYFQGHGMLSIQGLNSYYNHFEYASATATLSSSVFYTSPATLTNNGVDGFNLSLGGNALAFQSYYVTLMVNASAGGDATAAVEAALDPLITIDPDFVAEGYSLVSSAVPPLYGQTSAESVPEPSTNWMMLAGGIGLLTIRSRRRDRASAFQPAVGGTSSNPTRPGP